MEWWNKDKTRWKREVEAMTSWFPMSQWGERVDNGVTSRFWEVIVVPIPPPEELALVIADLNRDGIVDIERDGRIRHSIHCHGEHELEGDLQKIELAEEAFLIELIYREPPGHPISRCLEPKFSKKTLIGHTHFYGEDVICPLFPPDGTWQWRKNTAADYLNHVALWLLKTTVWCAVKGKSGSGLWIGSDVGHTLPRVLRTRPEEDCPCGSGRKFRQCCMPWLISMENNQRERRARRENTDRDFLDGGRHSHNLVGFQ